MEARLVLSRNLRARREAGGLSIGALSERSGVAAGTISTIESNPSRANPTVDTVAAMAKALGIAITDLLSGMADPMAVHRPATDDLEQIGVVRGRLLHRFAPTGTVEMFDVRVAAGPPRTSPAHARGVYEHIWVVAGQVTVGPVDGQVTLTSGDYLCFPAWTDHTYEAPGDAARLLVLLSYVRAPTDVDLLRHLS